MKNQELLSKLLKLDVKLWVEGDRLRYMAPPGVMTPELQAELAKHKAKIIASLLRLADPTNLDAPFITPIVRPNHIPLSFAQQRLWFVDQMQPGNTAYNIFAAVRLLGPLDVTALEQGLKQIVQRHETLRTSFQVVEGQPYQMIAPSLAMSLPLSDLSALSPAQRETEVERMARAEAQRPFDLASGPLVRCSLLRLGEAECVLLLGMHHIISDGWSMDVFLREIIVLARAYAAGRPDPLPALPLQYADFAIWQRDWLQGEALDVQMGYWKKKLEGAPSALEIPGDHPRPAVQTFRGGRLQVSLPKDLDDALQALSRREGVTLYMLLLAAFKVLLMRHSGQTDMIVGSPVANRKHSELEGLIGFFINTLVLRTDISGNPGFRELLQRVREVCLGAYDHQDLPFEKLVDELRVTRDLSRNPLFQVMFILQNTPLNIPGMESLRAESIDIEQGSAQFDLSMFVQETADGLSCLLEYNSDLFEAETIERMLDHFQILLKGIVADPGQLVSDLPLLTEGERDRVLVEWNDTNVAYPQEKCVHELFEAQVEKTPDAVAVVFAERQLSYRELNERANQLAHYLQKQGVGPDVLVGICMERSLEMMIGLLGILKAGGAYVPIDPEYPRERLEYMLADAHVAILLTQERVLERLPQQGNGTLCLDRDWQDIAGQDTANPICGVLPRNLAYTIYTSGSTGKPKGAMNTHGGIRNRLLWMQAIYQLTEADRVLQKTPFSFDVSVWEFFWPVISGARLVMALPGRHGDPAYLAGTIIEQGITTMHFVPAMLDTFLNQPGLEACVSLERVICSGEELTVLLQSRFFSRLRAELHNLYGPTEAAVDVTYWACQKEAEIDFVPIGRPIANTQVYILDGELQPVPIGVVGELYIAGDGLARGYLNRPELTAEKFVPNPFGSEAGARMYRTGDLARYRADGNIEFLGRIDSQVKIRGFRIELGEIEAVLGQHPDVQACVLLAREDRPGDKQLVGYIVPQSGRTAATSELRSFLTGKLPEYMVPGLFVMLDELPLTPNGKVDRKALPAPSGARPDLEKAYMPPRSEVERMIAVAWQEVLQVDKVGVHDNFFDLGGHSLLMARVYYQLREQLSGELSMVELFRYPTISTLAEYIRSADQGLPISDLGARRAALRRTLAGQPEEGIAVIGLAGRFPGARNVDEFWQNLCAGKESISFFSESELRAAGVDDATLGNPDYVRAGSVLENTEEFDAFFFGYNPREAAVMDPQQRVFLESAWEALEQVGYDAERYEGRIGVYGSVSASSYMLNHLGSNRDVLASIGGYQAMLGNDKDFLTTRVSYKLNLKGPSINVQTACSSSLVAVHLACQGLLAGESDMALAGGVSISLPQGQGYLYEEGGIASPDGHCRAFDAGAKGTVGGNGVGVVVLKRLSEALADGDVIHAVIRGTAINNDGGVKVGYTAPSVEGQVQVIAEAQAVAGVSAETITYVEAHGTGTELGDPIEMAALTQAFGRENAQQTGYCALGSVKTNIGHLDAAAGVTGLIKTVLALKHRAIPASLHYERANPKIDFEHSPFYVNTELREWQAGVTPRRAGVSSFGIGGTNAHAVLEEAPAVEASGPGRPWQLLVLSAKTATALEAATSNLAEHLKTAGEQNLADAAYTLQVGRQIMNHRRVVVCRDADDAASALEKLDAKRVWTGVQEHKGQGVAFMFTGQGAQYVDMGRELYEMEPVFREQVDRCADLLEPMLGLDLRTVIYPEDADRESAAEQLVQTWLTQPALFVIEYALAQLWMWWGVKPEAMIGHSIGEYVAACLAGVFSLEDALVVVAARGRLMQALAGGGMLAVQLAEAEIRAKLGGELSLAAVNGAELCVVSGTKDAIALLEEELGRDGVACQRLQTSHAFHSAMMEPMVEAFCAIVGEVGLRAPEVAFVSNVTGEWITAAEATDPAYWGRHLRQTVRFGEGLGRVLEEAGRVLLEIGPGRTLSSLAAHHPAKGGGQTVLASLPHRQERQSEQAFLLGALGRLWLAGVGVDWSAFHQGEHRHRVPLPTYPFERQRCWIEPNPAERRPGSKKANMTDWFYVPSWKRSALEEAHDETLLAPLWLLFTDQCGLGPQLSAHLEKAGREVITIQAGASFAKLDENIYTLAPGRAEDYEALFKDLSARGKFPGSIIHLWNVTQNDPDGLAGIEQGQDAGFYSLLFLAQVLGQQDTAVDLLVISNNLQRVTGEEALHPGKATILGPVRTIPVEYPHIRCRSIDVNLSQPGAELVDSLLAEIACESYDLVVAYRGPYRWAQIFEPFRLRESKPVTPRLKVGGVYMITGGLGGMGLTLARHLAQTAQARLILIGRSMLPARDEWERLLSRPNENEEILARIRQIKELETLGAEVMLLRADVADLEQIRSAVGQALERFGKLDGVIHAAGVPGGGLMQLKTREMAEKVLAPKVKGTLFVSEALKDQPLDFLVLCSSLNSVTSSIGQVDYCAANGFMDAFAHSRHLSGPTVISVNWNTWSEVGMAVEARKQLNGISLLDDQIANGLNSAEGTQVFDRILANRQSQVLVSKYDLPNVIEQSQAQHIGFLSESLGQAALQKTVHPRPQMPNAYVAPRNETEQTLAAFWQELLGVEQVGIHDNFFDLGGDSLLILRVVSRAKQAGLSLTPQQIFQHQTISELAEAEGLVTVRAEQDLITGPVPLTVDQHWLLNRGLVDPHCADIITLLEARQPVDPVLLVQAFTYVSLHHDGLRMRFAQEGLEWRQFIVEPEEDAVRLQTVDFSGVADADLPVALNRLLEQVKQTLNLFDGPLMRVVLINRGPGKPEYLLHVVHHLLADGVSNGVVFEDFLTAYWQLGQHQDVQLLPKTTSLRAWAERLHAYARSDTMRQEAGYWLGLPWEQAVPLPVDFPGGRERNIVASAQFVRVALSVDESRFLLDEIPRRYRIPSADAVVMALTQALTRWSGGQRLSAKMIDSGRSSIPDASDVDLSRTVGWLSFTRLLLLQSNDEIDPLQALRQFSEQFRQVPNHGLGYELLLRCSGDRKIVEQMESIPQPDVWFNYSGGQQAASVAEGPWRVADLDGQLDKTWINPQNLRSYLLFCVGGMDREQLVMTWEYSENVHERATIEQVANDFLETLRSLIAYCESIEQNS